MKSALIELVLLMSLLASSPASSQTQEELAVATANVLSQERASKAGNPIGANVDVNSPSKRSNEVDALGVVLLISSLGVYTLTILKWKWMWK